jgi:hypothetical protein
MNEKKNTNNSLISKTLKSLATIVVAETLSIGYLTHISNKYYDFSLKYYGSLGKIYSHENSSEDKKMHEAKLLQLKEWQDKKDKLYGSLGALALFVSVAAIPVVLIAHSGNGNENKNKFETGEKNDVAKK